MAKFGRYFTISLPSEPPRPWHFADHLALRVGIPNAEQNEGSHVRLADGETLELAMARKYPDRAEAIATGLVADMKLAPGQYYRRMARPSDQHPERTPGNNPGAKEHYNELAVMRGQLISLMHSLVDICQVVHPDDDTWGTYGHEIRNLLILASTEVEAHWRGVLIANGYQKARFSTKDYVLLKEAMKLGEYGISLPYYPWLPTIKPPTQDLPWYDAYNAVKHDREQNFSCATLGNAVNAVAHVPSC